MTRMRDVIRGMDKDVFDKAFDAFNKDAAIVTGQFHICNIITRGPADLSRYNASQQFIQESLTLRRETKDRVIIDEEAGRAYTVGPSSFPNGLVRRQIGPTETFPASCSAERMAMHAGSLASKGLGGVTHVIGASAKIIAQGSMDKLQTSLEANRFIPSATEARNAKGHLERLNDIAKG